MICECQPATSPTQTASVQFEILRNCSLLNDDAHKKFHKLLFAHGATAWGHVVSCVKYVCHFMVYLTPLPPVGHI